MSRVMDEHRIGYFGDWAESDCRGPSILNTAFLADAQESLKVTRQPHTTGRTNDLVWLLCCTSCDRRGSDDFAMLIEPGRRTGPRWEPTRAPLQGLNTEGRAGKTRPSLHFPSGSARSDKSRGFWGQSPPSSFKIASSTVCFPGGWGTAPSHGRRPTPVGQSTFRETVATPRTFGSGRRRHTAPRPFFEPRQSRPSFRDCCLWPSSLHTSAARGGSGPCAALQRTASAAHSPDHAC